MGHSKKIITMDIYGDNKGIIEDGVPEIEAFMQDGKRSDQTDILPDIDRYLNQSE